MNFRQVEAFRTVMAAGSVTGAAQLLSVSQPAVSRLLADFERTVGFPLFRKKGRNLVATEEGLTLYHEVKRAFVGLDDLKTAAEAIRSFQTGTINLVTMPGLASRLLPELIATFSRNHPDVGVWLEVLPRREALKAVAGGQYHLGIATGPIEDEQLQSERLCRLQAWCVVPANHPLSEKKQIRLQDLEGERFVSLGRDSLFRYKVMTMLEQHGVKCRFDIQARTADAIYGIVSSGLGVSIIGPELPDEVLDHKIVFRPLSPALPIDIDLVTLGGQPIGRMARQFSELAAERCKSLVRH